MSAEECRHLLAKLQIVVQLIQSDLRIIATLQENSSREKAHIVKHVWIELADC